jgi:hypothetical protein
VDHERGATAWQIITKGLGGIPLGRPVKLREVVDLIAFLASPRAASITDAEYVSESERISRHDTGLMIQILGPWTSCSEVSYQGAVHGRNRRNAAEHPEDHATASPKLHSDAAQGYCG